WFSKSTNGDIWTDDSGAIMPNYELVILLIPFRDNNVKLTRSLDYIRRPFTLILNSVNGSMDASASSKSFINYQFDFSKFPECAYEISYVLYSQPQALTSLSSLRFAVIQTNIITSPNNFMALPQGGAIPSNTIGSAYPLNSSNPSILIAQLNNNVSIYTPRRPSNLNFYVKFVIADNLTTLWTPVSGAVADYILIFYFFPK
ncbi:MAG TPA: hypothetical protein V6C58_22725, partial [Allocoleopsis sp.]